MLLTISGVLATEQLHQIRTLMAGARFQDGRLSAGREASRVKHNEEMVRDQELYTRLNDIVMGSLVQHAVYQQAVLPHRVAAPFYARYVPGMDYGDHVDDPIMGPRGQRYRSDVSTTVFLSSPEDYEGGELVIRSSFGEQRIKLAAGDAVVYPSSSTHHVAPVSAGERLVAVTWAQSLVRDPGHRELLYSLAQARDLLLEKSPDARETALVSNGYTNLVRMWAEV
ncbi:MAG TPA: Fe2+-dependent dioxygenase [Thiohalobacter sp.]|nr:Fe2+-dependent dioxygenase [Thiohalobacter sp.]